MLTIKIIFTDHIKRFFYAFVDFLLPARCIVTGEIVERDDVLSHDAWSQLQFIAEPMCEVCGVPFGVSDLDETDSVTCASCFDYPPVFHKARSALLYDDGSRGLLLGFKHGDKTHMALPFAAWLERVGEDAFENADLIVPVPLHWTRLIKRRYNQAGLLAQCLSKRIDLPVDTISLKRVRRTQPQGHMKMRERRKNIKGAFMIEDKNKKCFNDKKIVLIDDVYTTGVTVNECAQVLLDAGAKSVFVLCVARTVYS